MSDVWTKSTPTIQGSNEACQENVRCQACQKPFWRPKGSNSSHGEIDPTVSCTPDAEATTNQEVGRWVR